jgi:Tol biopolymer transport system component
MTVNSAGGDVSTLIKPNPDQDERYFWPQAIPNSRSVLFTIVRGSLENSQIAVLDLDTKQQKVLTRGHRARYAPTGHLIFGLGRDVVAAGFDVHRLELITPPTPVLQNVETTISSGTYFDLADNGVAAYVPGGTPNVKRTLVWVSRNGTEETIPAEPLAYGVPRIAPDGTRIVAHTEDANFDVVIYDIARKSQMRLTFERTLDMRPLWSSDGHSVLFRSDRTGPSIYKQASDGSGTAEKVIQLVGDGSPNAMSNDAQWLLFTNVDPATSRDIWIMALDGSSKPQPLINEPGNQGNPVLSPDGKWMAYHDEAQGHIYVRPFPNVNAGRWQVSPENSKWPLWSRDGRELFFVSGTQPNRGIMAIGVQADGNSLRWTAPKLLVNRTYSTFLGNAGPRNYDISPDGKRFVVIKDADADSTRRAIVIVENWFEELKRLVPVN